MRYSQPIQMRSKSISSGNYRFSPFFPRKSNLCEWDLLLAAESNSNKRLAKSRGIRYFIAGVLLLKVKCEP